MRMLHKPTGVAVYQQGNEPAGDMLKRLEAAVALKRQENHSGSKP